MLEGLAQITTGLSLSDDQKIIAVNLNTFWITTLKCHWRFLSYFDTSMTIANASNGILKNTQSEGPFKQIIVASLKVE